MDFYFHAEASMGGFLACVVRVSLATVGRSYQYEALDDFGVGHAEEQLDDAWILTMPSFCRFEGLDLLTVYFCYRKDNSRLWIVVLEIHNIFGECHIHIFEVGRNEEAPNANFDHQWYFPRAFPVLPVNRFGRNTAASPSSSIEPNGRPQILTSLRAKHVATFRTLTVLAELVAHPVILFLTLPRISRQVAVLHYRHRLDPSTREKGGIGWQQQSMILERAARYSVNAFLALRADALGVCIKLRPGDSSAYVKHFDASTDGADRKFGELVTS
ncbi:hypothetical protein BGW80DRAFT_1463070 [Lactifluus volemus]|nr:hypothetical protein BGW80DRAFT_1463070 [Lactifluus volemus]